MMILDLKALKREARSENTSSARLIEIAALDPKLSRVIAKSPHTSVPVLERLARSPDVHTRQEVICHPSVTPAILEELSSDRKQRVLASVAFHPLTPATALELLARHPHPFVRSIVAKNKQISLSLTANFANDPDPTVRGAIASSPTLSPTVLQQLSDDSEPEVRAAALFNPQTDFKRRLQALDDLDGSVRSAALWLLRENAAAGQVVALDVLERVTRDAERGVRAAVAMYVRWSLSPSHERDALAESLLSDEYETVRIHAEWTLKGAHP